MGKKNARNRNAATKKKVCGAGNGAKINGQQLYGLHKLSCQSKEFEDLSTSLEKCLTSLLNTFRLRLRQIDEPYTTVLFRPPNLKPEKIDEILTGVIIEFTEELYKEVKSSSKLSIFLFESYKCIESAGNLLNPLSETGGVLKICKLSYFHKILKHAIDSPNSDKFSNELKILFNELSSFSSSFKEHSLLPLDKLVCYFGATCASKEFANNCATLVNEESSSEISVDEEVEEFMSRLEKCEKLSNRNRPLVSQEWISFIRKKISRRN